MEVDLTLSDEKSAFGLKEILVVGQKCGSYGRRPNDAKVDAISQMKDCLTVSEVRRFLGACVFYKIWIPHFAHIAEPLYNLLRKRVRFIWTERHSEAMARLKNALLSPPVLRSMNYNNGQPMMITIDSSPIATGWAVGQNDEEGNCFATRFGAKVF